MVQSYVDRGGELSWLQPYAANGINFYGLAVKGDQSALRAQCDRYLNGPLGQAGRFVPACEHVLMVWNSIDRMQSEVKPEWGWVTEQETAVWLLVADKHARSLAWFHPYMLVDNDAALVSGREVYGFPKALGWFEIPPGPTAPSLLSVETMLVRTYGKDAKRERGRLMQALLRQGSDQFQTASSVRDLIAAIKQLLKTDLTLLEDPLLTAELTTALIAGEMGMVFLKQFRSGLHPTQTSFQCLQRVDAKVAHLYDARIYLGHQYEIEVFDADSHPIRRDLGLAPGPLSVDLAFWVKFDLTIGDTTLIGGGT